MKEYFLAILAVAVIGGIIISLSPDGNSAKYIKLLCGLCTVGCIIIPIVSYAAEGDYSYEQWKGVFVQEQYVGEYDEIYNNAFENVENTNADILLKNKIIQALRVEKDDFDIHICLDNKSDGKSIEKVEVKIYSSGIDIDPRSLENYVYSLLKCQCVIYYDF